MWSVKDIKQIVPYDTITTREIEYLIIQAYKNHMNYVFVDKNIVSPSVIEDLKKNGYSLVIGQGEVARIKISW